MLTFEGSRRLVRTVQLRVANARGTCEIGDPTVRHGTTGPSSTAASRRAQRRDPRGSRRWRLFEAGACIGAGGQPRALKPPRQIQGSVTPGDDG
ncbi:MAG TPA: hypothetical protein PKC43_09000 [Phycisphaerales bacterium]|nr:hypothetical protein [Phycisphaerales bacterium]HMP37574.1 hypothetical protein [Phycisphaerales bacterium]